MLRATCVVTVEWHQRDAHHVVTQFISYTVRRASYLHGVLQVALELVQHVLGPSTEKNRARLGFIALLDEHEVLLAELLDLQVARGDVGRWMMLGLQQQHV